MRKSEIATLASLSLFFGVICYFVSLGIELQLNANITGNYQRSFLGAGFPLLAMTGGLLGVSLPWMLCWLSNRRDSNDQKSQRKIQPSDLEQDNHSSMCLDNRY